MQKIILFLSFQSLTEVKELTILHTNDLHAHLFPRIAPWISESRKIGGFANLATLVKQEKQSNPSTILIDAGDYFSGPYISTLTEGEAVIKSMNYLGIDAACIGNHEFDHGWDNMLEQIKEAEDFAELSRAAIVDEDYPMNFKIQDSINSKANKEFLDSLVLI